MKDIGIIGLAGSGKDTAADPICAAGWLRDGFACALKRVCLEMGWDGHKDVAGRKLLQVVGMAGRAYDPDLWVKRAAKRVSPFQPIVWTDVRFPNEADYIRNERNGVIIRVIRPGMALEKAHQHESELNQYKISADYTVQNEGSIADLHAKICSIIKDIQNNENANCKKPVL